MRTIEVTPAQEGTITARPAVLQPFNSEVGTTEDEVMVRLQNSKSIALGGLSLVGKEGYMVGVIGTLTSFITDSGEKHLRGWSLHMNHPEVKFQQLRFFDTSQSIKDIELPIPNCMTYFSSSVDNSMTEEAANADTLVQIAHFVTQFISDAGPPKGIDWPE